MIKKLIVMLFFIFPGLVISGECEKENARDSIVCLEKKIDRLLQNYKKLNSSFDAIMRPSDGKANIINVLRKLPKPKITATATSNSVKFDVVSCARNGGSVHCSLLVTNKGADIDFFISNKTQAFNDFGEPFKIGNVKLVKKTEDLSGVATLGHRLIKNVPVKMNLEFIDMSDDSTQFTTIDVAGYRGRVNGHRNYVVLAQLRNVAFAP